MHCDLRMMLFGLMFFPQKPNIILLMLKGVFESLALIILVHIGTINDFGKKKVNYLKEKSIFLHGKQFAHVNWPICLFVAF